MFFKVSVNFGPHFKHPPKDLKYQPVSASLLPRPLDVANVQLTSLEASIHIFIFSIHTLFFALLFLRPLSDERHGLGSRDRAHAGGHAVPRGDGRGRAQQPPVGRVESAANPPKTEHLSAPPPPVQFIHHTLQPSPARPVPILMLQKAETK